MTKTSHSSTGFIRNNVAPKLLLTAFLFASQATYAGLIEGLQAYDHKNWSTAYSELMPLAEKGNAKAMGRIGSLYRDGKGGVAQDYTEAMRWYRAAADGGDVDAQYNLGVLFTEGKGIQRDYKEAMSWYLKAAKQGDAGAQYNIGVFYQRGSGVAKNNKEAISWYQKAAKQGDVDAKRAIAAMSKPQLTNAQLATLIMADEANNQPVYREPKQTEAERYEQIRSDGCAMSNYDCKTDWSGGKY